MNSEIFYREGNIFDDLRFLSLNAEFPPILHHIEPRHDRDYVTSSYGHPLTLYQPLGLSLQNTYYFNSVLSSLSTRLANRYLVIRIIQGAAVPFDAPSRHRNESCECMCAQLPHTLYSMSHWIRSRTGPQSIHTFVHYCKTTCVAPR